MILSWIRKKLPDLLDTNKVVYDPHIDVYTWKKGLNAPLSSHFNTNEFACKCKNVECVEQKVAASLVGRLEQVRGANNQSIIVTSGYRCQSYQEELGERGYQTAKNSQHVQGRAADIQARDMKLLYDSVDPLFKSIGVAKSFLHVDLREDKLRRWSY